MTINKPNTSTLKRYESSRIVAADTASGEPKISFSEAVSFAQVILPATADAYERVKNGSWSTAPQIEEGMLFASRNIFYIVTEKIEGVETITKVNTIPTKMYNDSFRNDNPTVAEDICIVHMNGAIGEYDIEVFPDKMYVQCLKSFIKALEAAETIETNKTLTAADKSTYLVRSVEENKITFRCRVPKKD